MNAETLARRRALHAYPNNTSYQSAYCKGARARRADVPRDRCPYKLNPLRAGWSKAFRAAWLTGWESEDVPDDDAR